MSRITQKIFKHTLQLSSAFCLALPMAAYAAPDTHELPTGANVTGGNVTFPKTDVVGKMNIHQHTDRAAIDWQSFNIGSKAHVHFEQPSPNAAILNRETSA